MRCNCMTILEWPDAYSRSDEQSSELSMLKVFMTEMGRARVKLGESELEPEIRDMYEREYFYAKKQADEISAKYADYSI